MLRAVLRAAKHQKVHFRFAQMLNKQIGWSVGRGLVTRHLQERFHHFTQTQLRLLVLLLQEQLARPVTPVLPLSLIHI